jgi:hypothetical protein
LTKKSRDSKKKGNINGTGGKGGGKGRGKDRKDGCQIKSKVEKTIKVDKLYRIIKETRFE